VLHPRYLFRRGRLRGRKPVLIVITDGISQDNVVVSANSLKRKGIEVFSLGFGHKFRRLQLQQIASSPSHVMTAGFRKLSAVLAALKHKACMPFVPRKHFSYFNLNKDITNITKTLATHIRDLTSLHKLMSFASLTRRGAKD